MVHILYTYKIKVWQDECYIEPGCQQTHVCCFLVTGLGPVCVGIWVGLLRACWADSGQGRSLLSTSVCSRQRRRNGTVSPAWELRLGSGDWSWRFGRSCLQSEVFGWMRRKSGCTLQHCCLVERLKQPHWPAGGDSIGKLQFICTNGKLQEMLTQSHDPHHQPGQISKT